MGAGSARVASDYISSMGDWRFEAPPSPSDPAVVALRQELEAEGLVCTPAGGERTLAYNSSGDLQQRRNSAAQRCLAQPHLASLPPPTTQSQHTQGNAQKECFQRVWDIQQQCWQQEFKPNQTVSRRHFLKIHPEYTVYKHSYPPHWSHPDSTNGAATAVQQAEMNSLIRSDRPVPKPILGKFNTQI